MLQQLSFPSCSPESNRGGETSSRRLWGWNMFFKKRVGKRRSFYEILEKEIAAYKGYKKGIIFSNGYMANMSILCYPTHEGDVIFSDELNHSSLIDSMRLSRAKKVIYRHKGCRRSRKKIQKEKVKGRSLLSPKRSSAWMAISAPLADIHGLKNVMSFVSLLMMPMEQVSLVKGTGIEECTHCTARWMFMWLPFR